MNSESGNLCQAPAAGGRLIKDQNVLQRVDRIERHVAIGAVDGAQHDVAHVLDLLLQVHLDFFERAVGIARNPIKLRRHLRRHARDDVAGMEQRRTYKKYGMTIAQPSIMVSKGPTAIPADKGRPSRAAVPDPRSRASPR